MGLVTQLFRRYRGRLAHDVHQIERRSRLFVRAPRHMLIGTNEGKATSVERSGIRRIHIDDRERDAAACSRFDDARHAHVRVDTHEHVVRSERIV